MAEGDDEHALLLQISYDLARLQKQGSSAEGVVDRSLTNMEKRAKKAAANLEEAFSLKGANLEGALGQVLQSSRLKVLDEGAAKIGLFGGALESLGPIGIGAAAGIGVLGVALEKTLKLGEYSLEIEHTAHALNLTTTQVQQFGLDAAAGGVDSQKLIEGISGINRTIGNLESGAIRGKILTEFVTKLGISPENLRSWGTLNQQLPHVLDALAKLNPQERAGIAQRFKLDPETLDQLVELRGYIDGVSTSQAGNTVMTAQQIEKNAAFEEQLKLTSAVIDNNFRQALVNLSPVIAGAQGLVGSFSDGLLKLETGAMRATTALGYLINALQTTNNLGTIFGAGLGGLVGSTVASGARGAPEKTPPVPPPVKLINQGGSGAGELRAANDDLDAADKLLADAQKALATSFQARADFEVAALKSEETKASQKLSADLKKAKTGDERASIEKAQAETAQAFQLKRTLVANQLAQQIADQANAMASLGLTGEAELLKAQDELGGTAKQHAATALRIFDLEQQIAASKLQEIVASKTASDAEKARAALELANLTATAPDRRQRVANEGQIAQSAQQADLREQALQQQIAQLEAEKGVAKTTEQRRQIALQLFALDEQLQENKLREQIAEALIAGKTEDAAKLQGQLGSLQSTAGLRGQAVSNANPVNAWAQWAQDAKAATQDVGESLAKIQVDGIEKLNDSLFDSEGRFNKLSTIARNVARDMIKNFEQFGVKSIEGQLFGGGGPGGSASGTPGGGLASSIGKLFGLGGGSKAGGVTQQIGTQTNPMYVVPADPSGGAVANGWQGLFGTPGQQGAQLGNQIGGDLGAMAPGASGGQSGGLLGGMTSGLASLFGGGKSGGGGGIGGFLSSLFGGGASGGAGGALSLGDVPGFAGGGQFVVGGKGGVDRNLLSMKVSQGERVTIETPQQQRDAQAGGVGGVTQHFNFPNSSVDGFKRSQRQWGRQARMGMQYAGA